MFFFHVGLILSYNFLVGIAQAQIWENGYLEKMSAMPEQLTLEQTACTQRLELFLF